MAVLALLRIGHEAVLVAMKLQPERRAGSGQQLWRLQRAGGLQQNPFRALFQIVGIDGIGVRSPASIRSSRHRSRFDVLPFGRLWYEGPEAVANAIGYAQHCSRSYDAVIRVYDAASNVIETHEHKSEFKEW